MKNIRKFYGDAIIKLDDLDFDDGFDELKIEYYKILGSEEKTENAKFGIEVLKRIKFEDDEIIERKKIDNFLNTEDEADKLLNILQRNKVTPISVEDVVKDLYQ